MIVGDTTQIVRELSTHKGEYIPDEVAELAAEDTVAPQVAPSLLEIGSRAAWIAERKAIQDMLLETRWNRREAARRLKVSYKALLNKIRDMELEA